MPELPEVETVKRQLQRNLVGKKIRAVLVHKDKMVKVGPGKISNIKVGSRAGSQKFAVALRGARVLGLQRRAKFLTIRLAAGPRLKASPSRDSKAGNGLNLMIHLRMSGQLIYRKKRDLAAALKLSQARTAIAEVLPTRHSHVEFEFSNGDKLFYNDTRQFGHIRLVKDLELAAVFSEQKLGPEPLALKLPQFYKIIGAHRSKRAKDFLLNQSIIAGIGNIYADESLFMAQISPLRKVGTLPPAQAARLLAAIQKVLRRAIKFGGSSIEYFLMTNGSAGKFAKQHLVYAKGGKPCPNCGRLLQSQKIGSRTSTFCRHCQK